MIFLDIHMPSEKWILDFGSVQWAQIIVLTAFVFENAQQALRLGVSDILSKPVDFEQLKAAIFRAVGWKFTSNETVNLMLNIFIIIIKKTWNWRISKVTYSTESHLARLFKKHMGITILSYSSASNRGGMSASGHECDIQEASFRGICPSISINTFVGMTGTVFGEVTECDSF